jgi:hypothetical protein
MDDDLLAINAGPPPTPPAPDAPADPIQPGAEGDDTATSGEDVRALTRRRLDAAGADVRQLLVRTAFAPYETGRLAVLLEQAAHRRASRQQHDANRARKQILN